MNVWYINSILGAICLEEENDALCGVHFCPDGAPELEPLPRRVVETPLLQEAEEQLNEYFAGVRREFDLPLSAKGTAFQQTVWAQLRKIPYGEVRTYGQLAAALGKETIDTYNTGESRGRETSHSLNYQKLGKELMSQDELAVMDGGKCILQLRGVRPFLSDKYDITKHPNFKYTADADDKNAFDIEAFLSARLKLKPNEVCDVYEVDTKGA
mgnify:CR=1 FL=1